MLGWLGSLVVRALDLRHEGREFDSLPPRLVLGWVTVFGLANHLSISRSHPGQLSLVLSAGQEMSTGQSAVMLCGWGVKAGMVYPIRVKTRGWQVKLCDLSLTCANLSAEYRTHYKALYESRVYFKSGTRRNAFPKSLSSWNAVVYCVDILQSAN